MFAPTDGDTLRARSAGAATPSTELGGWRSRTGPVDGADAAGRLVGRVGSWVGELGELTTEGWTRRQLAQGIESLAHLEAALAAAQARLLAAVSKLDDSGGGGVEIEHRTLHRSRRESRRRARRAQGLDEMPSVAAALARGRITGEHADVMVQAAERAGAERVEADPSLLEMVSTQPVDVARRTVGRWISRHESRHEAEARAEAQRQRREGRWWVDRVDGMHHYHFCLDPASAAAVDRVLDAETNRLWRHDGGRDGRPDDIRTPAQRRADAFSRTVAGVSGHADDAAVTERPGVGVDIVVSVDLATLVDPDHRGRCEIVDTGPVPPSVLERILTTHAGSITIRGLLFDGPGRPLWLGRRRRLANDDLRAVLAVRDGGCVRCAAPTVWCEAHHELEWLDGGTTDPDNLSLLCSRCHTEVHRQRRAHREASTDRRRRRRHRQRGRSRDGPDG